MDINLVSIVYLFFRLAPFIIVCFFTLNSIINQDLRGLMYLCGLLLLVFAVFISPNTWMLLIMTFILLIRTGIIIPSLTIFKPLRLFFKGFSSFWKSIFVSLVTSVIVILILGSYFLHIYEFGEIKKINKNVGVQPPASSFDGLSYLQNLVKIISNGFDETEDESDGYCMEFSINGSEIKKPLAASIYGFTYGYLMYYIHKNNLFNSNIPVITLFPVLAIGDMAFQKFHHCRPGLGTNILAGILGLMWGINWGDIIASTKNASLQYFVGANQPVCSVPTSQNFVCNVYKNGQLIATQTNG